VSFLPNNRILPVAALLLLSLPLPVRPIEGLTLSLGTLSGPGWRVEQLRLELDWSQPQQTVYSLSARRLTHPALAAPLEAPRLECREGVIDDREVRCDKGLLQLQSPLLDRPQIPLAFHWSRDPQRLSVKLDRLPVAGGEVAASLVWDEAAWRGVVRGSGLSLLRLQQGLAQMGVAIPLTDLQGDAAPTVHVEGTPLGVTAVDWNLVFQNGGFSDEPEGLFAEALRGTWKGEVKLNGGEVLGSQRLQLTTGALLTPWVYLEPGGEPVTLSSKFRFDRGSGRLTIDELGYRHPKHLDLSASGLLQLTPEIKPVEFRLATRPADLGVLFDAYLAPVLGDDLFQQLLLKGRVSAELKLDPEPNLEIRLKDVSLASGEGDNNHILRGIEGELFWRPGRMAPPSTLSWQAGRLFGRLELGPARLSLRLSDRGLVLLQPARLPLLDGALQVGKLALDQGEDGPLIAFQGYLEPISMAFLSRALGWPELSGQLSGMIPEVAFKNGVLSVSGIILIRLFGGTVLIRNLRLEGVTGPLPVLMADIQLKGLDLEALTRTFSFGKITGRLEGQMRGLRLEGWRPVAFDARFNTPANDDSRHRISQKAVDNISNLGGSGVSGALSRSFLRIFEEFGYDRLGISCRLRNGVCEMDGIEPADRGYYLVKGGGIPRIDIIGFNRTTDWDLLVTKLKQITRGGSPVIE
jgi:hypothetical protein